MSIWFFPLAIMILALVFTGLLRRYALSRSLMDIPNARSSHSVPTPRGGGVAIVLGFLLALLMLHRWNMLESSLLIGLFGAGAGIALLGFLDDHGHIAARWRLLGHFAAALWVLYWLDGLPPLSLLGFSIELGWLRQCLAVLYLVWLLNLYNFMDGIDGIASVEAISVCFGAALALFVSDAWHPKAGLPLFCLAGAVAGFLFWNFSPARIFMGDAGSGFLGLMLGALSLQAASIAPQLLWSWLILLGVFVVDATFTLSRRLLRGDKIYEAHRSHAYQYASRRYGSHLPVTVAVAAINFLWLLPLALWVAAGEIDGVLGVLIAYGALLGLAVYFKAGRLEVKVG